MKKLNIGCGLSVLDDWINIDNSLNAKISKFPRFKWLLFKFGILSEEFYEINWPQNVKTINVKKGLPYNDEDVDYIFSSHFIEHLRKDEAKKLLKECLRVLKKGGLLRLTTPDLQIFVKNYLKESNENSLASENFLDLLKLGEKRKESKLMNFIYGGGKHRWIYDENSLKHLLKSVGFSEINIREYQKGEMLDIEFLDNRPEESLYIEAKK